MKKILLCFMMTVTCFLTANVESDKAKFKQKVEESEEMVLVDFYSRYCPPCRMLAPEFNSAANEMKGKVSFFSFNIDQERGLASEYKVQSLPTLLVFKGGKMIDKRVGYMPCDEIVEWLNFRLGE